MLGHNAANSAIAPKSVSQRLEALWPASLPFALRTSLLAGFGIALLILSAKIKVPFYPVPMTLQTLSIALLAAVSGPRLAVSAVLGYLFLGAAGVPVFTNTPPSPAGLIYFMGPTGGYLAGFAVSALIIGMLCQRGWDRSFARLWAAMFLGDAALIGLGISWLAFGGPSLGIEKAVSVGLYPFVLGALIKQVLGATMIRATSQALLPRLSN